MVPLDRCAGSGDSGDNERSDKNMEDQVTETGDSTEPGKHPEPVARRGPSMQPSCMLGGDLV